LVPTPACHPETASSKAVPKADLRGPWTIHAWKTETIAVLYFHFPQLDDLHGMVLELIVRCKITHESE
jgi:hypothetical protein